VLDESVTGDQIDLAADLNAQDDDGNGQVHFAILPGSVSKSRHLLDRGSA
jgi:hypothetical protein